MTVEAQRTLNRMIEDFYELATIELADVYHEDRLRSCNATVLESPNYYFLKSYSTIVAIISKRTDTLYDVLRFVYGYTATSAQHIAKFNHDYSRNGRGCNRQFRWYEK